MIIQSFNSGNFGHWKQRAVLKEILFHGPISRTAIAHATGLNSPTVTRITRDILNAGIIVEKEILPKNGQPGRRFIDLELNPRGGYIVGIGINATEQWITLADLQNNTLEIENVDIQSNSEPLTVLKTLSDRVEALISRSKINRNRILGGSVAISGVIAAGTGQLISSSTLGWKDVDIQTTLSQKLGIPFIVDNIPNSLNLAESLFGAARGRKNVLLVYGTLGVGASMLLDKHLIRGIDNSADSLGNIRFNNATQTQEEITPTLNEIAGGQAILNQLSSYAGIPDNIKKAQPGQQLTSIIKMAQLGDAQVNEVCRAVGVELGKILEPIVALIRPEAFILAGPISQISSYAEGVRTMLENIPASDTGLIRHQVSTMTIQSACRWLALNEFVAEQDVDLDTLLKADTPRYSNKRTS